MSDLDRLVEAARAEDIAWSKERADRVLRATLRRHEQRGRLARRALAVASAAAVVVLFVLRGAAESAAPEPAASPDRTEMTSSLVPLGDGDGGYARD